MFETLKKIISKIDATYADVRYEQLTKTEISIDTKELNSASTNVTGGYVLRVLKNGGFSSVSFIKPEDIENAVKRAVENASLIAKHIKTPVVLAKAPVKKNSFKPNLEIDPRSKSLEDKISLLHKYNDIPLRHPKVTITNLGYAEVVREKYFLNSEGTEIQEDLVTTSISGLLTASEGNILQNIRVKIGGSNGFKKLLDREDYFDDRTKIVVDLLRASPVHGGSFDVVLNPSMTGVFVHEAFGHSSEADIIENSPTIREKMRLGEKLGSDLVNIKDDPTMKNLLGFYRYDDEGVEARPVQLMKNGILTGRLHSRRTAAAFSEPITGHSVAEDYRYSPIIRMGTIFLEQGTDKFETLLAKVGNGVYVADAKGGQTSGENFTFGAQYGYLIKDGKLSEMIRDINLSGNLYKTLQNIFAIGNEVIYGEVGGCGKGQMNIRSCSGAPYAAIKDVVIGGV